MKKLFGILTIVLILCGKAYGQTERHLIYEQSGGVFNGRYIVMLFPKLSVYANVEGEEVTSYSLCNEEYGTTQFEICFTIQNFSDFREALNKFIEWEKIAVGNNLDSFNREIPIAISSDKVTWKNPLRSNSDTIHRIKNGKLSIIFTFIWNTLYVEGHRASLSIDTNTIQSDISGETFILRKVMSLDEIRLFLDNTTSENILNAIRQSRQQKLENERQQKLQDELFR